MRVFLVFIDGFGLGRDDPSANPFLNADLPTFRGLFGGRPVVLDSILPLDSSGGTETSGDRGAVVVPLDAALGVPGLPQSATGQTAILTGINAPMLAGRHLNAHPTNALIKIIRKQNVFLNTFQAGKTATFINAYRPEFFRDQPAGTYQASATTVAALSAGLPFRSLEDVRKGRAVYHDITNWTLIQKGYHVPPVEPEEAGRRAAQLVRGYDFSMFEYFLTDLVAHEQDLAKAVMVLETLDRFLGAALAELDLGGTLVAVVSDHGNIEDLSARTHTRNPVPAILVGAGREKIVGRLRDLTDIAPALLEVLKS